MLSSEGLRDDLLLFNVSPVIENMDSRGTLLAEIDK